MKFDVSRLSRRELEILSILQAEPGISDEEVAETLRISKHTVKTHLGNVFAKTGCTNRVELSMGRKRESKVENSNSQDLTLREAEIAGKISKGDKARKIASELGLSVKTVETHTSNAMRKLNIHKRGDISLVASVRE